ncbi:MAG TPA: DUF2202 domain-containing protein [Anaerolineae bacterium]|nr:DUF2202 domain-containing protein [Anaerolineae bacterium]
MTMKTKRRGMLVVLMALAGVLTMGSVALAQETNSSAVDVLATVPTAPTPEDIDGLVFMVEEEKLTRDVYQGLYEVWGEQIFENIARSEQTHMDAIGRLLERYDIESPVADEAGVFANPELQALYDDLMETGSQSLADALLVGAAIEEIDILDLEEYLAETALWDIQRVYENLLRGSQNHLRAFVRELEVETGEVYEPQYMSQEAYDEILNGSAGNGGWGGRAGNGPGSGRSGGSRPGGRRGRTL